MAAHGWLSLWVVLGGIAKLLLLSWIWKAWSAACGRWSWRCLVSAYSALWCDHITVWPDTCIASKYDVSSAPNFSPYAELCELYFTSRFSQFHNCNHLVRMVLDQGWCKLRAAVGGCGRPRSPTPRFVEFAWSPSVSVTETGYVATFLLYIYAPKATQWLVAPAFSVILNVSWTNLYHV